MFNKFKLALFVLQLVREYSDELMQLYEQNADFIERFWTSIQEKLQSGDEPVFGAKLLLEVGNTVGFLVNQRRAFGSTQGETSTEAPECPDCPELKAGINEQTDCDFDELLTG